MKIIYLTICLVILLTGCTCQPTLFNNNNSLDCWNNCEEQYKDNNGTSYQWYQENNSCYCWVNTTNNQQLIFQ